MSRLPTVGSDSGNWGDLLNEFLSVSLGPDGNVVLESWANAAARPITAVAGQIGVNLETMDLERYDGTTWSLVSVGINDVQTLTNKRITTRVIALTDASTVTINSDSTDMGILLTLSQSTTIANPTGTPTDGQWLVLRIKSTTSRTLTFGNQFRSSTTLALPASTQGSSLTEYYTFIYNSADVKWDILAVNVGF